MRVDLHMHTTCSDGVYTPAALIDQAVQAGLDVIAISDHDTIDAYSTGDAMTTDIRIIPAMEMSSDYDGEDVHILGYYLDTNNLDLQNYCRQFKKRRQMRAMEIVERCKALGYDLDSDYIESVFARGGTIGRPHIARMLVAKGYFADIAAVFDAILYRGGPAYVPYQRKSIDECIDLIHGAGGLAVLAHPGLLKKGLSPVLSHPFDGIEVYHPKNQGRYDEFIAIAEQKGWYISGGSDFHGVAGRYPEKVGMFSFDAARIEPLLQYAGK